MMITVVLAAGLFIASWLPRKLQPVLFAAPYALFVLLDLYALFKAIGPQLARWPQSAGRKSPAEGDKPPQGLDFERLRPLFSLQTATSSRSSGLLLNVA